MLTKTTRLIIIITQKGSEAFQYYVQEFPISDVHSLKTVAIFLSQHLELDANMN